MDGRHRNSDLMPVEDKLNLLDVVRANTCTGVRVPRLRSLHGFPVFWQHIECQRVTVGVLIAFQYGHRRQHMPDAIIVEDVTLTRFAHREAIHFLLIIISNDDFAALSPAAADEMRGDVLFPVFMQARWTRVARPARHSSEPY